MGVVISQRQVGGVQTQGVARDAPRDRAGNRGARGGGGAIVGLGQGTPDTGGGGQDPGCDDGRGIGDLGRAETVVRSRAVGCGRADGQCATAAGDDFAGAGHMGRVVRQADAAGVQSQGVASYGAGHRAGNGCTRGGGGTVINLGERAADAGGGRQGFRRDRGIGVGYCGCGKAVVPRHTVGRGRIDVEGAVAAGRNCCGREHVRAVIGQGDPGSVEAQAVAGDAARDGADDGGARGRRGAIVSLGQGAADGGRGGQGLGRDGGRHIGDHRRDKGVVAGHTGVDR